MKAAIRPATREEMLRDYPTEVLAVPGWYFRVCEVSAGVWKVEGRDCYGHSVERYGTDNEPPLDACAADALKIVQSLGSRNSR